MTIYDAMTRAMGNDFGHGWLAFRQLPSRQQSRQYSSWLLRSALAECSQWVRSTPVPQAAYARTLGSADNAIRHAVKGLGP